VVGRVVNNDPTKFDSGVGKLGKVSGSPLGICPGVAEATAEVTEELGAAGIIVAAAVKEATAADNEAGAAGAGALLAVVAAACDCKAAFVVATTGVSNTGGEPNGADVHSPQLL
jgi:hypothetical protein